MTEIEKLVAFVEQTICCGDACLCPGGDCFQSMERGKAVAVIRRTLEFAAGEADKKLAWYRQVIGNNPTNQVLAEKAQTAIDIAKAIRSLSPKAGRYSG